MDKFKRCSLQTKLMIFFMLITSTVFIITSVLLYRNSKNFLNSSKEKELLTLSQETANKIDRFLFERYGDLQVMSESPILRNTIIDNKTKWEYLENMRAVYKTYDYILISDLNGNSEIIAGELKKDSLPLTYLNYIKKGCIYVSDFNISSQYNSYGVIFAAPIYDDKGNISKAVVERMNFFSVNKIVKDVDPGNEGHAYLVDEVGNIVVSPYSEKPQGIQQYGNMKQRISFRTSNNKPYVSAFTEIKNYETQKNIWRLVVEQPSKEAFWVTYKLRNYITIVVFISIIALLILSQMIIKLITKPIKSLVIETKVVVENIIGQHIKIDGQDEIGNLTKSFNLLLSHLNSMMQQVLELSGEAASLEEFRQIAEDFFENVPRGVIALDNTKKVTIFNKAAAAIIGEVPKDVIGKKAMEFHGLPMKTLIEVLEDGLEENMFYTKQLVKIKHKEGKEVPIIINTSIQRDFSGNILGVIGVFKSSVEIKRFEESIIRAKNLASLGKLSAGMAHEIRNPLTSIKGYAQYIKMGTDNEELTSDLDIIIEEVDRLNGIVDRFLSFARPNQPDFKLMDINEVINSIIKLLKKEYSLQNIKINYCLGEVYPFYMDFEQIKQALLNLILNAIQAMPNGGELSIYSQISKNKDYNQIEIKDSGMGINEEDYEKIFEPFYTTKDKGTGLGLAISGRIIENHKGIIEVKSVKGEGTSFIIKFPVHTSSMHLEKKDVQN